MCIRQFTYFPFFIFFLLFFSATTVMAQGLYINGQWDIACEKCWQAPYTADHNHCSSVDCAIQGYYHCKPQNPPLALDDDVRLMALIKSGECTYLPTSQLNEAEKHYLKQIGMCTHVLDKMAGRFNSPANPQDVHKLKMDFYFTYLKASVLGNAEARLKLAMDYDLGFGTHQDRQKATALYRSAALAGIPFAQYAMGARYAYGIALPKDKEKALMWLHKTLQNKPASQADKKAQALVSPCAVQLIGRLTLN